jgi:hypothetical protein
MGENLVALTLIFALFSVEAHSRPVEPADVVKLYSRESAAGLWREGSGVVLAGRSGSLVLTSYHVAYSSPETNFETHAQLGSERKKLKWVASDWARGLALFQVEGAAPAGLHFSAGEPLLSRGGAVRAIGYPHGQQQLYELEGVFSGMETSSLFLNLEKLLEVLDLDSELGMSGGALVSSAGDFLGILSHQKRDQTGMRTLVIPAAAVKAWLAELMSGKFQPRFVVEAQNLNGVELRLFGSGWRILAEPGINGTGARVFLTTAPMRSDLEEIPELAALAKSLETEGRRMKQSLQPGETHLLNSLFLWAGFRPKGPLGSPEEIKVAANGVEFLRHLLHSDHDVFFINSGFATNYLASRWQDYFVGWESDKVLYRKWLGPDLFGAVDKLAEFERARYSHLYGLPNFFAFFRPEEIEQLLFSPALDSSWRDLQIKQPGLFERFHGAMKKSLALLSRAAFVYERK